MQLELAYVISVCWNIRCALYYLYSATMYVADSVGRMQQPTYLLGTSVTRPTLPDNGVPADAYLPSLKEEANPDVMR